MQAKHLISYIIKAAAVIIAINYWTNLNGTEQSNLLANGWPFIAFAITWSIATAIGEDR